MTGRGAAGPRSARPPSWPITRQQLTAVPANRRPAGRQCRSSRPCPRARRPRSVRRRLHGGWWQRAWRRQGVAAWGAGRGGPSGAAPCWPHVLPPRTVASATREHRPGASLPHLHLEVGGREHLHELRVGLGGEGRIDLVRVGAGVGVGCRVRLRAGVGVRVRVRVRARVRVGLRVPVTRHGVGRPLGPPVDEHIGHVRLQLRLG